LRPDPRPSRAGANHDDRGAAAGQAVGSADNRGSKSRDRADRDRARVGSGSFLRDRDRLVVVRRAGADVERVLDPARDRLDRLAELLGIPRSTVHELARRGELPARRVGRRWLFLRERIAAAIAPLDDPAAWHSQRDANRP